MLKASLLTSLFLIAVSGEAFAQKPGPNHYIQVLEAQRNSLITQMTQLEAIILLLKEDLAKAHAELAKTKQERPEK